MNRHHLSSRDPDLEQLAERFAHWRQYRATPRERIPDLLWEQAISLCQTRPPSRVAKRLRLGTSDLKKRCPAPEPSLAPPVAMEPPLGFVEVQPASWPQSGGVQLEMHRADGTRLQLASQDASAPLAELIRTFLEVK